MKTYIGKKTIKAEPMTKGEASQRGLLQPGRFRPGQESDPGMLVEYSGGYRSWSPLDAFDDAYKPADTALERMDIERWELDERIIAASDFLDDEANCLDEPSRAMLQAQLDAMRTYWRMLAYRRIRMENGKGGACGVDFAAATSFLKRGWVVRRYCWPESKAVFMQVPANIGAAIIPNMTSLPKGAKDFILGNRAEILYDNQCLIYDKETGEATSWSPTCEDVFSQDWMLVVWAHHEISSD